MSYVSLTKNNILNKKIFLVLFGIFFIVFVFTSDGHRYTIDEDITQTQALRIITQTPHLLFVENESKLYYEYTTLFPNPTGPTCKNAYLCSNSFIGHTITQIPFIAINHYLHIVSPDSIDIELSFDDFGDYHYAFWRNNINSDFTFMEIFYGPFFSALSVGIFFLILRTFNISTKNSILLSFFFALTTPIWAYSQTSLNSVPATSFVLLGFFFFRKFQLFSSPIYLLYSGIFLGFSFLIRPDAIYFIIPMFILLIYIISKNNNKIKNFLFFSLPLITSYVIYHIIQYFTYNMDVSFDTPGGAFNNFQINLEGLTGLLFAPGLGLFIFAPILLTFIFSFLDFFKKYKLECILFSSFIIIFIFQYSNLTLTWHGFISWTARYLYPIIPFLLIPLGISLQNRSKSIYIVLILLGSVGFLANFVYVIQDVAWFVWGQMGEHTHGLYVLDEIYPSPYRIHPATIWTFEYSQFTHSVLFAINQLRPDIFFLKFFGHTGYTVAFILLLISPILFLIRLIKSDK